MLGASGCNTQGLKLWIHQDLTEAFKATWAFCASFMPGLLQGLYEAFAADGYDFAYSVFRDRDESDCFAAVVDFDGDADPAAKIAQAADAICAQPAGGGAYTFHDCFSSIPSFASNNVAGHIDPDELALLLIITTDFGKYHNLQGDWPGHGWPDDVPWSDDPSTSLAFEGETDWFYNDEVVCDSKYKYLVAPIICEALTSNSIIPIVLTADTCWNFELDSQPVYRWFFEKCGLKEDDQTFFLDRYVPFQGDAITYANSIVSSVQKAKCLIPNPATSTSSASSTTETEATAAPTTPAASTTTTASADTAGAGAVLRFVVIGVIFGIALLVGLIYLLCAKRSTVTSIEVLEDVVAQPAAESPARVAVPILPTRALSEELPTAPLVDNELYDS